MANYFDNLSDDDLSQLEGELSDLAGEMITENGFQIEILCDLDGGDESSDDLACSVFDFPTAVSLN